MQCQTMFTDLSAEGEFLARCRCDVAIQIKTIKSSRIKDLTVKKINNILDSWELEWLDVFRAVKKAYSTDSGEDLLDAEAKYRALKDNFKSFEFALLLTDLANLKNSSLNI